MDTKRICCLISTLKDWSSERKNDVIFVLESLRDCFTNEEPLFAQNVEDTGVCGNRITIEELTKIINELKK